jgi:hypothetical protein
LSVMHCNTLVDGNDNDYYCTRCQRTVIVKQEVEAADIVESESMDDNPEPLVSYTEDPDARFYKAKTPEYQGGIRALSERGSIHITSYTERSGDRRITSSWNDGSNSSDSQHKIRSPRPIRFTEDRNSDSEDSEE